MECGHLDVSQRNASTLGVGFGDAHEAGADLGRAVVSCDDQVAFANNEEGLVLVHCAGQDCASRDVHGASVEAIAEVVIDWHLNLGQLEQFGLQAIDQQVLCWHLLLNFLNRSIAHGALL